MGGVTANMAVGEDERLGVGKEEGRAGREERVNRRGQEARRQQGRGEGN